MGDKPVHSLPVDKFRYGQDDFKSWVDLFEKAINISYKGAEAADIDSARDQWLPLKLDDKARLIYEGVTGATWLVKKANLQKALIDPQQEYLWHSRRATIVWDGVESFQSLGTRIKREVNNHHTENLENEYFFRFRLALPKDYQRAIDLGCSKTQRNLTNAIDIAERLRVADADAEAVPTPPMPPAPKAVSFSGAAMNDDRLKSLELAMQGVTIRLDNIEESKNKAEEPPRSRREEAKRDYSDSRDRRENRSPSRDSYRRDDRRDDRRSSYDRRDDRDSRRPRYDSRERYRAYDNSPYRGRSRRDSYERRDSGDRYGRDHSRGYNRDYSRGYDRRESYDRRDSLDRRDRYRSPSYQRDNRGRGSYNRDRYDSRDGWGRRDSWDRDYRRGPDQGDRNRRDDNRRFRSPRRDDPRPEHRLAEFNNVDWLCAAISEKRDREQKPQEN